MALVRLLGEEAGVLNGACFRPGAATLDRRLARLRELRGPAVPDACARVRDLVVLASSSRSGSSMLAEMLRECDALLHLRAEINPFLRLVGLAYPDSGTGSDRLAAEQLYGLDPDLRRVLDTELALEMGSPAPVVSDESRFGLDVAWRMTMQWPELDWDPEDVAKLAMRTLEQVLGESDAAGVDWRRYQAMLVGELRLLGYAVDTSSYDGLGPGPAGTGAPGDLLIEEPPFVLPRAWRPVREEDLATRPLVVKTPSDAYRLGFLRALFPNARVRVIHLTRNPAGAINGLYDGWRHHGFHAHRMPEPLDIAGYTDHRPQDRLWWKFDLPPGWQEFTDARLLDVCAFQWRSCHRHILDDLDRGVEHLRLRFEDLIGPGPVREETFARLADWLEVPADGPFHRAACDGIAPVAATVLPSPGRWRLRAAMIRESLDPRVRAVAEELGYETDDGWA